jgi:hypothetical protein
MTHPSLPRILMIGATAPAQIPSSPAAGSGLRLLGGWFWLVSHKTHIHRHFIMPGAPTIM